MNEFPAKLDPATEKMVMDSLHEGHSVKAIAEAAGCSTKTVSRIKAKIALDLAKQKEEKIFQARLATRIASTTNMAGMSGQLRDAAEKALTMVTEASDYNELSAASKSLDAILRAHHAQEKISVSASGEVKPKPAAEVQHKGSITFHVHPALVPKGQPNTFTYGEVVDGEVVKELPPSTEETEP